MCKLLVWFLNNPDTYKHSFLPYGRDLTGDVFRKDLEPIFRVFANNANKIRHGGSTKDVGSLYNMIAAKPQSVTTTQAPLV